GVHAFGSYDPIDESALEAGQRVIVYCELTGLRYESKGPAFISRLSSRIELRAAGSTEIAWEQELGSPEDGCRRRRRDYYVNYLIELPHSVGPGAYTLRLIQTDRVADCSASKEIPCKIVR